MMVNKKLNLLYMQMRSIQGAFSIDARFVKCSAALAVFPIMTKFSQFLPFPSATKCRFMFAGNIKGLATGESKRIHCPNDPRRRMEDGG